MTRRHPRIVRTQTAPVKWDRKTPIRMADLWDEPQLLDMWHQMHAEQPYHPSDISKVSAMFRLAIAPIPERRGIIGVIGERHHLVGGLFLMLEPVWYSQEFYLRELFNYVRPEARKSTYAKDLIAYGIECSEATGMELEVGVFSNIRTEAKCRLYDRFLERMGAFYRYVPTSKGRQAGATMEGIAA